MNAIVQTLNTAGRAFIGSAVPMLIQSSLLILILLAVDAVLRKRVRAVFRYWIWMLVLVKLVLPPSLWSPVSVGTWFGDTLEVPAAALLEAPPLPSPEEQGQDALATRRQGRDALATPEDATGPLAVIWSTYTPADAAPADWPIPYSGKFQVSGTFGFLFSYEVLGLAGTGEELFNVGTGRIEQRRETYTLRTRAGLPPLGIKANPHITIEQTLTMELIEKKTRNPNLETRNKSE